MRSTTVGVWYNMRRMALLGGYEPGDGLYFVTAVQLPADNSNDIQLCEQAFRLMNSVDGNELPSILQCRSMSVGDAVEIDGRMYFCQPFGWKTEDEANGQA